MAYPFSFFIMGTRANLNLSKNVLKLKARIRKLHGYGHYFGDVSSSFPLKSWQYGLRKFFSTDLKRFLEEVGTNPKEARFWLRLFQHQATDPENPFAILEIQSCTMKDGNMMEKLCSSLSFLQRNDMPAVLVYGPDCTSFDNNMVVKQGELMKMGMQLVDYLEKGYGTTRTFCGSSGILYSKTNNSARKYAAIEHVNVEPLKWAIRSGHIPLLTSLSIDQKTGMVSPLCPQQVAIKLSGVLKPFKVIFLNETGGLVDNLGKVISHVNVPGDISSIVEKLSCEPDMKEQIDRISNLINNVPAISSAVITSPDKILKELFTHRGSGTIFQRTEAIHRFKSLREVDIPRLTKLLTQSFKRPLKSDYMEIVEKQLSSVYISESYSAAAVVIQHGENCEIPYLDKFVISSTSQGKGTSEALWDLLTRDFRSLFWRARATNKINPWYFMRADGSWSNGDWIIFWYGVDQPKLSHSLVEFATNLPESFDPIAEHDDTQQSRNKSTTSYVQYI